MIDRELGFGIERSRDRDGFRKWQTGAWEYLLCEGCEDRLNRLCERDFERTWYQRQVLPNRPRGSEVVLRELDVFRFRLFHLSILWRASISRRSELFHEIRLEPRHQESIRQMLWRGHGDCFPTFTFTANCLTVGGDVFHCISDGQRLTSLGNSTRYAMMYAGCLWIFYIGDEVPPAIIQPWTLQRDGTMRVTVQTLGDFLRGALASPRRR